MRMPAARMTSGMMKTPLFRIMFVPLMVEGAFFIDTLEGMRPEVIAQGLDEVGPCLGTAVSVEY